MSLGKRILEEIIRQGMVRVVPREPGQDGDILVWSANVEEQLKAVVQNHMTSRDQQGRAVVEWNALGFTARTLSQLVPANHGFILMVMPTDGRPDGRLSYVSSVNRKDAIAALKEWLIQASGEEDWMKNLK